MTEEQQLTKSLIWCLPTKMLEADLEDLTVAPWIKELIQQELARRNAFKAAS